MNVTCKYIFVNFNSINVNMHEPETKISIRIDSAQMKVPQNDETEKKKPLQLRSHQ